MTSSKDDSTIKETIGKSGCGSGCGCHQKAANESKEAPDQPKEATPQATSDEENYKEKYLRLLAENENLRRRLQRESQEAIRFATQKVILELLEPYDNFEKALFHAGYSPSEDVRNWAHGFKMIHQQFKEWLNAQGVYSYPAKGQPFNAQLHEAVEVLPSRDAAEGTVIEELFKGYKMHERVLRPAKVVIAKNVEDQSELVEEAEKELSPQELEEAAQKSTSSKLNNPS